ncbi:molybdenum cofactor guanylyltransferase [Gracilibacillus xinjiangensis]|uniref:Probable molybdenum cofactor guanylyltransferase n=1 Tax=Gracilibacillus xinjiangensis TaxID=1193282 RepID=A0ABV8WZU6_9BACI
MDLTGVIIAGGESSRFGKPKAFAKYKGKELYLHAIDSLGNITNKISVIAREEHMECYQPPIHLLKDDPLFKGLGPLAGLYTVMSQVEADWYITLPVDTPCVNREILQRLLPGDNAKVQAFVPIVTGRKQPLIATYHYTAKQVVYDLLIKNKRSMHGLLDQLRVQYITFDDSCEPCFYNVNTEEELRKLQLE